MPKKESRWGKGELPFDYVRRHVVEIKTKPLGPEGRWETERYMVISRRLDGRLSVEVEHQGQLMLLPHLVVGQVQRDLTGMIRQERRDKARQRRDAKVKQILDS